MSYKIEKITKNLSKMVANLRAHADSETKDAESADAHVRELVAIANAKREEAIKAEAVAAKIEALLN